MKPVKFKTTLIKMGAWTMAAATVDTKKIFETKGYIRVKGTIDGVPFKGNSLMPRKDGSHIMAINGKLRKAIRKQAGDEVLIIMEKDHDEKEIPAELKEAFEASSEAKQMFDSFTYSNKKYVINHIAEAISQATKDKRAVESILRLEKLYNEKFIGKS